MTTIAPLNQRFPVADANGFPTPEFIRFMTQLYQRVGGAQGGVYGQLTDDTTIQWNLEQAPSAFVILGGNRTLANPIGMVAGSFIPYRLTVIQDGTGSRLLTWGSAYKFPGGVAPTLTTTANRVDEFWFSSDGSVMRRVAVGLDIR
jgi:hypothetical protein